MLYHLASKHVRTLKSLFDERIATSVKNISDGFSDTMEFKTIYDQKVIIQRWIKPNLTFSINIDGNIYGKKNYLLDRFLIKKIYEKLEIEFNNSN